MHPGSLTYRPTQGTAFEIFETDDAGTIGMSQMRWLTDDLDSEVEQLRKRGVVLEESEVPEASTPEGVAHMPHAREAWFRDTEGNLLCITQLISGPAAEAKGKGAGSTRLRDPIWILGLPPELLTGVPAV